MLEEDRVIWVPSATGDFSVKTAYEALKKKKPRVKWHSLVWGKLVQPKDSFTTWLLFVGGCRLKIDW
ncbi:hypothetical protein ACHQM5_010351 [Ranunculus cassubicifolius]